MTLHRRGALPTPGDALSHPDNRAPPPDSHGAPRPLSHTVATEPSPTLVAPVVVVLVRSYSPPSLTPTTKIDRSSLLLSYVAHVCFKYFRRFRYRLQLFYMNVASVSEGCCKRLFKMFHLFLDVCCNRFDLDVAYVFKDMLQQYVPKCFICFSLLL